jgi:hypothetical protein
MDVADSSNAASDEVCAGSGQVVCHAVNYAEVTGIDYTCKDKRQCVVDVGRRNQCQACRFQKCLQSGMNRDGRCCVQQLYFWPHMFI